MRQSDTSSGVRPPAGLFSALDGQVIATLLDTARWTVPGEVNFVFVLASGSGTIVTQGESSPVQAPNLIWIPAGQSAELMLLAGSRGAYLTLSDAALGLIALPGNIAEDMRRFAGRPQLGTQISREEASRLATLFALMVDEMRSNVSGSQEIVRHQLSIVLILLWRIADMMPAAAQPAPRTIVNNFLALVDQQVRSHWTVASYARYLGVSVDRLGSAVRRATGQTPLELIQARVYAEARQLVENSGMQIAEVSAHMGFEDPAYFSRFFKRLGGQSPRQCRLEAARAQVRGRSSFAAWP